MELFISLTQVKLKPFEILIRTLCDGFFPKYFFSLCCSHFCCRLMVYGTCTCMVECMVHAKMVVIVGGGGTVCIHSEFMWKWPASGVHTIKFEFFFFHMLFINV